MSGLDADLILVHRLADAAREAIAPFWRAAVPIEDKADHSPVTAADRAAEAAMRRIIEADRPMDGIIGEEYGPRPTRSGRMWVLDPIDGTRAFVAGRPLYGTLIGLLEGPTPVVGVIDAGAAGDRWVGVALGQPRTTLNGRAVTVRPCARLAAARAATTHPAAFSAHGHAAFQRVGARVADMLFGGDCHNYGLLAAGCLDLVVEEGLKLHDWAALVPVVAGAGGLITDWAGQPLVPGAEGRVLAAGDRRVHAEALSRL
jgi:histidinol phosphatase-like enzyme (inositol monophosphatase family)